MENLKIFNNGDKISHYTNQNPISEQAWINSVLGQMGLKKSSKYVKENNDTDSSLDRDHLVYYKDAKQLEIEDKSRQKKEEIIKKFNDLRKKRDPDYMDDDAVFKMAFRSVVGEYLHSHRMDFKLDMQDGNLIDYELDKMRLVRKPSNESNQEVSELVDSINKLSNILSSNNNNLPTDPIAMEEFVEKLDVLGDLIGNLMEADEADEADEESSKSKKIFISKIDRKGSIRLPHTPVVSKQISLRVPSAEKIVLSVIQKLKEIRSKLPKETTKEEQEFLNAYKSAFLRQPHYPLGPDEFRSFVKIKKSFPNLFKS